MVQNISGIIKYHLWESSELIWSIYETFCSFKSSHCKPVFDNYLKNVCFYAFWSLWQAFSLCITCIHENTMVLQVREVIGKWFWYLRGLVIVSDKFRRLPKMIFNDSWYILDHLNDICVMYKKAPARGTVKKKFSYDPIVTSLCCASLWEA